MCKLYAKHAFFFFGCPTAYGVPRQGIRGSDPSHSCNLSYSCDNARSSTHCAGLGIEPVSQCSRDTADLIAPQQELQNMHFFARLTYTFFLNRRFIFNVSKSGNIKFITCFSIKRARSTVHKRTQFLEMFCVISTGKPLMIYTQRYAFS